MRHITFERTALTVPIAKRPSIGVALAVRLRVDLAAKVAAETREAAPGLVALA